MATTIYNDCMRCICVGGGEIARQKLKIKKDDFVIGVDKGFEFVRDQRVDMVVGDFDSLGYTPTHEHIERLEVRKDFTDMWVACEKGLDRGCDEFVLYGALGGRLDHTIANLQLAYHLVEQGVKVALVGIDQTIFVTDKDLDIVECVGKTISIFARDMATISLMGFDYPAQRLTLRYDFPMGVSNVATQKIARVQVHSGIILAIVNDKID